MGEWTEAEKRAWFPPEKITPSQWAEKHRVLPPSAAEAGKLRLSRTPYMVGILDAVCETGVEEIVCLKSTQIAWSTATETLIGYWVDSDPGPIILCLDTEKALKEVMDERIHPMIQNTPAVKAHLSPHAHDLTLSQIKFDTCSLHTAWSGSLGSLHRREIRYGIFEECDGYKDDPSEGNPIEVGIERTQTYGYRRKILIGCTPTVRSGNIYRYYSAAADKRKYFVPCPHCGEYQFLAFTQIKYPTLDIEDDNVFANTVEQQQLAYYECVSCRQPIKEHQKTKMLAKGKWISECQSINKAGEIVGIKPKSKRVGFWINSLYSPWRSFSVIAAEFIRSKRDQLKLQNFFNNWLAEVWESVVKTASVDDWRKLLVGAPKAKIVPSWAEYIVATADVQKDRMYWVIRAWGANFKSQLIKYGIALSWDELRQYCLETQWQLERGGTSRSHAMFIDYGYRSDEVTTFAKTDERIRPVKGDNDNQAAPFKYSTALKALSLPLYMLNTQTLKDRLQVFRNDEGRWLLNDEVSDEYLQQLASEHKTLVKGKEIWETKSNGAANHYLDCEIYQLAGADILQVDLLKETPSVTTQPIRQQPPIDNFIPQKVNSFLGDTSNWLKR